MDIPEYTSEDFLDGTKPYEFVLAIKSPFEQKQAIERIQQQAKELDEKINFRTLLTAYCEDKKPALTQHVTDFDGQPMELLTGAWIATDSGVSRIEHGQTVIACHHPIMPTTRLINIETGDEKIELSYKVQNKWRTAIFDRDVLASNNKIVQLANHGISVTSETAKALTRYIDDVQHLNQDKIPIKRSVTRLGWFGDMFVPYADELIFDGEDIFKGFYDAVQSHGDRGTWLETARGIRKGPSLIPRVVLAASLASVLVKPLGGLPFFVHIWGQTEAGKTLALMLGASVWANPELGRYIHTFNATQVGLELSAAFTNNLPLMMDELQIIRKRDDFDNIIYQLAEGLGRARGDKSGGMRKTYSWANCIITTGEQPITSLSSGGGAINRTVELMCEHNESLFGEAGEPTKIALKLSENYGHIGKEFVELLQDETIMTEAKEYQQDALKQLSMTKTEDDETVTGKQCLSASLLLTADYIATKYIFQDDRLLMPDEISEALATKESSDQNRNGYEWLLDWIAENRQHFLSDNTEPEDIKTNIYGKVEGRRVSIIRRVFTEACVLAGYNPTVLAKWLRDEGISDCNTARGRKQFNKNVRIGDTVCCCVVIKEIPDEEDLEETGEEIPW